MLKETVVIGTTENSTFGVNKGKICTVLDIFFCNGEGHYILLDEAGNIFESPDIFWNEFHQIDVVISDETNSSDKPGYDVDVYDTEDEDGQKGDRREDLTRCGFSSIAEAEAYIGELAKSYKVNRLDQKPSENKTPSYKDFLLFCKLVQEENGFTFEDGKLKKELPLYIYKATHRDEYNYKSSVYIRYNTVTKQIDWEVECEEAYDELSNLYVKSFLK
jgi:hypothetical protein